MLCFLGEGENLQIIRNLRKGVGLSPYGKSIFIQYGCWEKLCSPRTGAKPSPTLDKILASMGPGILSSVGVGVWRKAPEAFPDSNATLDKIQSAKSGRDGPSHSLLEWILFSD